MSARESKCGLLLIFILTIRFLANQVEGSDPIPQIWEIADDISFVGSLFQSTRLVQMIGDDGVEVKKTVKQWFALDLDGLQQRNLTGFRQDLKDIARVFDEQCPSVEGCKVGEDLENGMELMRKLEDYTTLEQRIPNLMLMNLVNVIFIEDRSSQLAQVLTEKLLEIQDFPKPDLAGNRWFVSTLSNAANRIMPTIEKYRKAIELSSTINVTRAEEELEMLLRVQNETLNLATEQVLVDGFASSVDTLKLRTEKLKAVEEKVEKVISVLDWLVGVEDGVKDPLNSHWFVPDIRIADVERVTDVMAGKRLIKLTESIEGFVVDQLEPLRTAKKRLEKWLSVRRALRESGGAAVESDTIRSILGNVKSRLKQLPTVKSVRECMDKFNLTNLNLTLKTPTSIDERRRRIVDELVTPFAQIGFSEDDMVKLKKFPTGEKDSEATISMWKQISNLSALRKKLDKLSKKRGPDVFKEDEARLLASWLNNTGILSGVSCLKMDRKMDLINGSTVAGIPPLYSNNSDLTNIISMNRNLTQLETMWRDEKEEQLQKYHGQRIFDNSGNLTNAFSQLSSAFRTSALAIKYDTDYQLVVDNIEVINQTMEGLPVEVKNRALWSNEVPRCVKDVEILSDSLKSTHSKMTKYQTLDDLMKLLDGFQGDFECQSLDVFRRILPYLNNSLQPAVLHLSGISMSYASVDSVAPMKKNITKLMKRMTCGFRKTNPSATRSSVVWLITVLVVVFVISRERESAEVEKKTESVEKNDGAMTGSGEKIQKDSATGNVSVTP